MLINEPQVDQPVELPELRGPIISIRVKIGNTGTRFRFVSPKIKDPLCFSSNLRRGALASQRKKFYEELDKFKETIGSKMDLAKPSLAQPRSLWSRFVDALLRKPPKEDDEKTEWLKITESFKILRRLGSALATQIFGNALPEVQDFFLKAIPFEDNFNCLQRISFEDNLIDTFFLPIIEVSAPLTDLIPIEFLPLFDLSELDEEFEIESTSQLASLMRRFVGMSAIVKRVIEMDSLPQSGDVLENDPFLPISFFQHVGLPAARREYEFFEKQMAEGRVGLSKPWPDQIFANQDKLVKALGDALWLDDYEIEGSKQRRAYQIHHFACHCESGENNVLELASDNENPAQVSIFELQDRRAVILKNRPDKATAIEPLVFFNACESVKMSPAGISSFPELFLTTNSCGFIGTETLIPDTLASEFSMSFYRKFLRGTHLGLAIQQAKWELLIRSNNPLGILYVVYANPETHVRNPNKRAPQHLS
jgi:CHAT domain